MAHAVTCIHGLIPDLMQTWERVHMLTCHENAVSGLHVMGKLLITASFDRFIRCFDLEVNDMHIQYVYTAWRINLLYFNFRDGS